MYRSLSLCGAAAFALLASPAAAGTVLFQGLGAFLTTATANTYVAPGDGFTFSFDLDQATAEAAAAAKGSYTTPVDDFVYALNGVAQNVTLSAVQFDTDGLDLIFGDKAELEFRGGADLGSTGSLVSPTWSNYKVFYLAPPPKVVPSFRSFAVSAPPMVGNAMIVTSGPAIPASVPEPASWALMILGFGATGSLLRRARRRGSALA